MDGRCSASALSEGKKYKEDQSHTHTAPKVSGSWETLVAYATLDSRPGANTKRKRRNKKGDWSLCPCSSPSGWNYRRRKRKAFSLLKQGGCFEFIRIIWILIFQDGSFLKHKFGAKACASAGGD